MLTDILMQVPAQFLPRLLSGELVRYGSIIRDASSGQIVGFLKETGRFAELLSALPSNPLSGAVDLVGLVANIDQSIQLRDISKTIEALSVVAGVGATASVVTLGVSVVGFAVVLKQLNRMDSKLDAVAGDIQSIKDTLHMMDIKWDMMTTGKLTSASERLILGEEATTRKRDLLKEANGEFSRLRHYLYLFLSDLNPVFHTDLKIAHVRDLLSRYFTAAMGQLHSEFLLNDLQAYRKTLSLIHVQSESLTDFTILDAYRVRSDSRKPLDITFDHQQLMDEVKALKLHFSEAVERIKYNHIELDFIEQRHISASDYLDFFKNQKTDLVLIPVKEGYAA